jgi:hypothetical protein
MSVTRRAFIAASTGLIAAFTIDCVREEPGLPPPGTVYGRVKGGLSSGSPDNPSRGFVTLLDGRTLEATHSGNRIRPGKSVLLSHDGNEWSVLYAEA